MLSKFHGFAGALAMMIISTFWTSTVIAEVLFPHGAIGLVKQSIVYGLFFLVPAIAATGGSGNVMGKGRNEVPVGKKRKRMILIALNGILFMVPMALFLNFKAARDEYDLIFYIVQAFELIMGPIQLSLMGMSFRDGWKLKKATSRSAG